MNVEKVLTDEVNRLKAKLATCKCGEKELNRDMSQGEKWRPQSHQGTVASTNPPQTWVSLTPARDLSVTWPVTW